MNTTITLTPGRGRDYKSSVAVRLDLANDRDFIVADMSSQWDGKACNLSDLRAAGIKTARVRYQRLTKITLVDISRNIE